MYSDILQKALQQGGITVALDVDNPQNATEVGGDYWYYPLHPDKTVVIGEQQLAEAVKVFVQENKNDLAKAKQYLGIWRNPEDNNYYIDINERSRTKADAINRVKQINAHSKRQILAIYNPKREQTEQIE